MQYTPETLRADLVKSARDLIGEDIPMSQYVDGMIDLITNATFTGAVDGDDWDMAEAKVRTMLLLGASPSTETSQPIGSIDGMEEGHVQFMAAEHSCPGCENLEVTHIPAVGMDDLDPNEFVGEYLVVALPDFTGEEADQIAESIEQYAAGFEHMENHNTITVAHLKHGTPR